MDPITMPTETDINMLSIEDLRKLILDLQNDNILLSNNLSKFDEDRNIVYDTNTFLYGLLEKSSITIINNKKEIADLKTLNSHIITTFKTEKEKSLKCFNDLKDENNKKDKIIDSLNLQISENNSIIDNYAQQFTKLNKKFSDLSNKLSIKNIINKDLVLQNNNITDELNMFKHKVDSLNNEIEQIKNENIKLNNIINEKDKLITDFDINNQYMKIELIEKSSQEIILTYKNLYNDILSEYKKSIIKIKLLSEKKMSDLNTYSFSNTIIPEDLENEYMEDRISPRSGEEESQENYLLETPNYYPFILHNRLQYLQIPPPPPPPLHLYAQYDYMYK